MKYSIIMPYLKRSKQFKNTLLSFEHHYKDRDDCEIIIGEDIKNVNDSVEHEKLIDVLYGRGFNFKHIMTDFQDCYNPAPIFNRCVRDARGEFIVLTSPEVFHVSDVLGGFDEEFEKDKNRYIVAACESGKECTFDINRIKDFTYKNHMWYQHSDNRNLMYHFCTAIAKHLYEEIEGFDEEYGKGISYDDDDFIEKILSNNIEIVLRDDLLTVHQWHDKLSVLTDGYKDLLERNRLLFKSKWGKEIT